MNNYLSYTYSYINKHPWSVGISIFVMAVLTWYFVSNQGETFTNLLGDYSNKDTYPKSSQTYLTSVLGGSLDTGVVIKSLQTDGKYSYDLELALPSLTTIFEEINAEYIVYLGTNKNNLTKIGKLVRSGDGKFKLNHETSTNYSFIQINIESSIVRNVASNASTEDNVFGGTNKTTIFSQKLN